MFQKFFTNTIENKFIKALIYNTPIPLLPTIRVGDYAICGVQYIYRTYVIECTKTGIFIDTAEPPIDLTPQDTLMPGDAPRQIFAEYNVISTYIFGEKYVQMTDNYVSRYNYYDSDTHYQLGRYLRAYRDIYGIDLMPFYNCFNYKIITDFSLVHLSNRELEKMRQEDDKAEQDYYITQSDKKYKEIAIPIRFNETYTIAIDCGQRVLMKSIIYGPQGLITDGDTVLTDLLTESNGGNLLCLDRLQYNSPIYYSIGNKREDAIRRLNKKYGIDNVSPNREYTQEQIDAELMRFQSIEKYLYLIIQLPQNNDSSITVLEGEYYKKDEYLYGVSDINNINIQNVDFYSDKYFNKLFLWNLSLLQMNTKNTYAFSDRLIEYLLLNVIDYQDEIGQNTVRVQRYTEMDTNKYIQLGVFDRQTRLILLKRYIQKDTGTDLDINGFVDKDIEEFVMKGAGRNIYGL